MNLCINVYTLKSEFIKAPLSFVAEMPETPVPVFQSGSSSICLHQLFLAGLVPYPRGATKQCLRKFWLLLLGCGVECHWHLMWIPGMLHFWHSQESLLPTSPTNKELFSPNVNGAEVRNPDLIYILPFLLCPSGHALKSVKSPSTASLLLLSTARPT